MELKVEGHPNLRRDPNTGAILNSNRNAYTNYLINKAKSDVEKIEIKNMKNEISTIRKDLDDIKSLLLVLVQNKS